MAQSHFSTSVAAHSPPTGAHALVLSSSQGIAQWHIASAAETQEPRPAQPIVSGEVTGLLAAWRAAERQVAEHLEAGPERARLEADVVRLRDEYHRLFEAHCGADVNLRSR